MKEYRINSVYGGTLEKNGVPHEEKYKDPRPEILGAFFYEKDGIFYTDNSFYCSCSEKCKEIFTITITLNGCDVKAYDAVTSIGRIRLLYAKDIAFFSRRALVYATLKGTLVRCTGVCTSFADGGLQIIVHSPFLPEIPDESLVFEFARLDASLRGEPFGKYFYVTPCSS